MTLYVTVLHIRALSRGVEGEEALRENRLEMTGEEDESLGAQCDARFSGRPEECRCSLLARGC